MPALSITGCHSIFTAMEPYPMSPRQPADEGARRLALAHLESARLARDRIPSGDPESLHDYRVALRRLRSALRSYRHEVRSTVTPKSRRRLDALAHATNRSRDLEVHLGWLDGQARSAGESARPAIGWLTARLERDRCLARDAMLALDERLFPALHDRLRGQLSRYRATLHLDGNREGPTLAAATARHARTAARRLDRRLRRIPDETGEREIHRARIAAKHLRYLLEPFAAALPDGDAIVERLKSLQDAFGDAHDTHVFLPELAETLQEAERDGHAELAPGLRVLAASLRARGSQAFEMAAQSWLLPSRGAFFDDVRAARLALADRSRGLRPSVLSP
jgi:CHAD domain-containing protein